MANTDEVLVLRPQAGPQEAMMATAADISVAGGAAGGGKTWSLLAEPLRHIDNPHCGAVVFRRTYPQITAEGGLWDEAAEMYPLFGGLANQGTLSYRFPRGLRVKFAHMQYEADRYAWKGAQIPVLLFDQLEDFYESQFWFLTSRNRSVAAGFAPYVRATCNPVPDDDPVGGWLHDLVSWWIDQETGYARPDRAGAMRWFVRVDDEIQWGDTREEMEELHPGIPPRSFTFIPATLEDNQILMKADPNYVASLMALPLVEREQLRMGNWKIKPAAGKRFNRAWFKLLPVMPTDVRQWVRYWDKAGTEGGGAYSAGGLLGLRPNGDVVVADMERGQWSALQRNTVIRQKAAADKLLGVPVVIWVEQEPSAGGKESAEISIRELAGHEVHADPPSRDKWARSGPLASQCEAGNVYLVAGEWNEAFLREAHSFDGKKGFMDQVDAVCGAYNKAVLHKPKLHRATWGRR